MNEVHWMTEVEFGYLISHDRILSYFLLHSKQAKIFRFQYQHLFHTKNSVYEAAKM